MNVKGDCEDSVRGIKLDTGRYVEKALRVTASP